MFDVKKGDKVSGYFGLRKNRLNPRYLDIVVSAELKLGLNKRGDRKCLKKTKLFQMK